MHTLEDVREHLDFAHGLGLKTGRLFTKLGIDEKMYAIYASPSNEIRSVLGKWGSEIYDSRSNVNARKRELDSRGLQTHVVSYEAYGSEDCEIFPSMLNLSNKAFSFMVFHEGFHIHVKKNGWRLKPSVEEAVGTVFGEQASMEYYSGNSQMQTIIKKDRQFWLDYYSSLNFWLKRVTGAYAKSSARGNAALSEAEVAIKEIRNNSFGRRTSMIPVKINTAYLLRLSYYAPHLATVTQALEGFTAKDVLNKDKLYKVLKES